MTDELRRSQVSPTGELPVIQATVMTQGEGDRQVSFLRSGQSFTEAPPSQRKERTCIIAEHRDHAIEISKQMDLPRKFVSDDYFITWPGQMVNGHRFAMIMVTGGVSAAIDWDLRAAKWFNEAMRCRLLPDGKVVYL